MAGLSEEDVKRAKEAINVLSSLTSGNASSDSVADPSTSKPSTSGLGREGEGTVLDLLPHILSHHFLLCGNTSNDISCSPVS